MGAVRTTRVLEIYSRVTTNAVYLTPLRLELRLCLFVVSYIKVENKIELLFFFAKNKSLHSYRATRNRGVTVCESTFM